MNELIKMIEDMKIENPELEGEIFYNMAIKHVVEQIELYFKYHYFNPLGKNDYQE